MTETLAMIIFCGVVLAVTCWAIACVGNVLNWWNI